MDELVNKLISLQANAVAMYAQAHGYHWNVEGVLFKPLHAFFLDIYEDVFSSIDPISENIRKLGSYAPFGLSTWNATFSLPVNESDNLTPVEMLGELIRTNSIMIDELKETFRIANAADEQGIANFIAGRIDQHQFWNWQLNSTLNLTVITA